MLRHYSAEALPGPTRPLGARHFELELSKDLVLQRIGRPEGAPKSYPKMQNAPTESERTFLRGKVYHISNICQEKSL
jgi:hypothetical protein